MSTVLWSSPAGYADRHLDDDFKAARWSGDQLAIDRIVASSEAGNHLAKAYLSILYKRDYAMIRADRIKAEVYATEALPWLEESAGRGDMFALYNLGMCYADGRGVNKCETTALKFIKLAADQGHSGAQYELGDRY